MQADERLQEFTQRMAYEGTPHMGVEALDQPGVAGKTARVKTLHFLDETVDLASGQARRIGPRLPAFMSGGGALAR